MVSSYFCPSVLFVPINDCPDIPHLSRLAACIRTANIFACAGINGYARMFARHIRNGQVAGFVKIDKPVKKVRLGEADRMVPCGILHTADGHRRHKGIQHTYMRREPALAMPYGFMPRCQRRSEYIMPAILTIRFHAQSLTRCYSSLTIIGMSIIVISSLW